MVSLNSLSRALVTHIMSTRVLGCALLSGFVAIAGHGSAPLAAQATDQAAASAESPNYRLAGRFAPYKIQELIHSTSVEPNWIENSERFWYSWETGDGKSYYLVDPEAGTKNDIFDSDRMMKRRRKTRRTRRRFSTSSMMSQPAPSASWRTGKAPTTILTGPAYRPTARRSFSHATITST